MMRTSSFLFAFFLILFFYYSAINAQPFFDYPIANLSTTWTNYKSSSLTVEFNNESIIRLILLRQIDGPQIACGFFCSGNCTSYLFAIFFLHINLGSPIVPPEVIWSANRDHPVSEGAMLSLTATGELVLQDFDGSKIWTTNTTGKSVVGMNLTSTGNLVLFDVHNSVVWQSFDHPTDCLLLGQKLFQGQKLIPSVSSTDWTKGLFSLQVTNEGLLGYVESNPPRVYERYLDTRTYANKGKSYCTFFNGSLSLFTDDHVAWIVTPQSRSVQYMKLMPDGSLKLFQWKQGWRMVADLAFDSIYRDCSFPLNCGRNAICSNKLCSCPSSNSHGMVIDYFRIINYRQPTMGCLEITPLTCDSTQDQSFIALENTEYFSFTADMKTVNMDACKQACRDNCSCKAALFRYASNSSSGDCHLPSHQLFTLHTFDPKKTNYNASAFIKVQNVRSPTPRAPGPFSKSNHRVTTVLGSTIGSFVFLVVIIGCIMFVVHKGKENIEMEEEYFDQVPGMPVRFSYRELKIATQNFSKKLGEGGFGSVFKRTLEDGSTIAVKCLEGRVQVKKSFLAEVESVGSIHHVNLVRLRGFCVLKSQQLLVYEFMSNGSLDQWIYHGTREYLLEWECRKKIVLDIAKGLTYLHEDCRQKIIHLDIKPQNILLDQYFNAKIANFGLSKLVDRDQTQVMTNMRGTPGYLAPEWLSNVITEKVDVYSFGIVLLEILCGRKNFDRSQPEESWHLLSVFQNCWEQEKLLDIVDRYSEDMQAHSIEVVEMMKVASWCLQTDFTRRPSMSLVIMVLEGVTQVESNLDSNFTNIRAEQMSVKHEIDLSQMLPSFLSGPR